MYIKIASGLCINIISLPNNERIFSYISDRLKNKKSIQVVNRDSFKSIRIGKEKIIVQFGWKC